MENNTEVHACKDCGHDKHCKHCKRNYGQMGGGVYGLAMIGALIYYIQYAETFAMGALGVLKAVLWPVFLIYELYKNLGM